VAKDTDYPFIPSKLYRAGRKLNINIWDHWIVRKQQR
jgi:hypothetical protein